MKKMAREGQFGLNRLLTLNQESKKGHGMLVIRIVFSVRKGMIKGFQISICKEFIMMHINRVEIFSTMIECLEVSIWQRIH
jgi:hypothetical protein